MRACVRVGVCVYGESVDVGSCMEIHTCVLQCVAVCCIACYSVLQCVLQLEAACTYINIHV